MLEVTNLGDQAVDSSLSNPVRIVDKLPAGVLPTHVYGEGGGSFPIGINGVKELIHCGFASEMVTCTYAGPLLAYERFMIAITVNVEAGAGSGVSEVNVSGGVWHLCCGVVLWRLANRLRGLVSKCMN